MSSNYQKLEAESTILQIEGRPHKPAMSNCQKITITVGIFAFICTILIIAINISQTPHQKQSKISKNSHIVSSLTNTSMIKVTNVPTTLSPTTLSPTTLSPTTETPTTLSPTTLSPTTLSPTTRSPTTRSPTTRSPTTRSPTTRSPTGKGETWSPTKKPTIFIPSMPHRDDPNLRLKFAALGDWGVTDDKKHESTEKDHPFTKRDFDAQKNVAKYLKRWAKNNHPSFVLGQGDNFYWTGISQVDDHRWKKKFEDIYNEPALYCPWYNVMGNHDYGGGSGFCGPSCWQCGTLCSSVKSMEAALNKKFESQRNYKSPHHNRWQLPAHYYKRIHHYPSPIVSDFSIEIFNIETNAAGNRLAETCCQCFSTSKSPDCENPSRGKLNCINGHIAQYDQCAKMLKHWWDESMTKLKNDLTKSVATWKIVNNHYLLGHFTLKQKTQIKKILEEGGAHVFVGGHEHAEGHNLLDGVHHLENGGGGGAKARGGTGNVWHHATYGFFIGRVSKSWMQIQFFDDSGKLLHCYNIPQNRKLSKLHDAKTRFKCPHLLPHPPPKSETPP